MKKALSILLIIVFPFIPAFTQDEARLLRFPATNDSIIVFSYAGDLYQVDITGGMARKLTSHKGYEIFPRFSPDGKKIAFTGQYDGNTEIYLMDWQGGEPIRLTCTATLSRDDISDRMGPNNIVMSWTRDGNEILFRSRKQSFNSFKGQLFKVSMEGGIASELPLSEGGFCSYSPDGTKLAFNRVFREFRTWKYYRGGMADDIRIFNFETKEVTKITDNDAQDIIPMWVDDEIYYLSDRDRIMNLFVYNTSTKETKKVTDFTEYDIKFPSSGKKYIVFENGGYIYLFHTGTKKYNKVSIQIKDDFQYARKEFKEAGKHIKNEDLSPNGERALFSARGDIYTVPSKKGYTRNITRTPGVHERNAVWSPNGKYIAYVSDATEEFEIWMVQQDGSEQAVQLTKNADTYKYGIKWSPDSKKILWSDRKLRLQYISVETKEVTLVKQSDYGWIRQYNWSPDSKWITFTQNADNDFYIVSLYSLDTKQIYTITDNWYNSSYPVFSDDGKYLFFTSQRHFTPIYSQTEWNHAYKDMTGIYFVTLSKETPSPFAPENDEVEIDSKAKAKAADEDENEDENEDKENKEEKMIIDINGIKQRVISIPVKGSVYYNLQVAKDKVYYQQKTEEGIFTKLYDLDKKEEKELGKGLIFAISSNSKKMLVKQNGNYAIIDLPSGTVSISEAIDLSNMKVFVDYKKEWSQIFDESWRQMRDFFYTPNMHGLDWQAIHAKYSVLVPYVKHRNDLSYIIGEMIGELNVGHAYVGANEKPEAERIKTGLLGAKLSRHSSGYYQIDKILEGANWNKNLRSPLQDVGVNINEGDYILAVNGQPTNAMDNIYTSLLNMYDKPVELTVNNQPETRGNNKYLITPINDEASLYYYAWVQKNIQKVNEATEGQVGYVHIPDMSINGLNEFARYYYPQLNKKGLIIDDRGNGGGNVSPMIIERLRREIIRSRAIRNFPEARPVPQAIMTGPKVMLIDKYSASDGDLFPYAFKELKIGTLIGERTWGGVIGITSSLPFIDGTVLYKPEFASFSAKESKWIIEGHGVEPDIYVSNDPYKEYMGEDAQLDKAIEIILEELKNYKPLPDIPEPPDKTK